MRLLHFAHRGEAQCFIRNLKLEAVNHRIGQIYQNSELMLLIGGEGIYASIERVSAMLAAFPQIDRVINLGICGLLNPSLAQMDQVYSVGSVYNWSEYKLEFHSYHSTGKLDCVSFFDRVTTPESAQKLKPVAPLVDRELWGVARACHLHGVPFESYKLTSDLAGHKACLDIKNRAEEFSHRLFEHYLTLLPTQQSASETSELKLPFFATYQQQLQLKKVIFALSLKYDLPEQQVLDQTDLSGIEALDIHPKQKTSLLIEQLQQQLNPLKKIVHQRLIEFASPLTEVGAQVNFDPNLEKKEFTLSMAITCQKNISRLEQALKQLQFTDFEKIMDGDLNV